MKASDLVRSRCKNSKQQLANIAQQGTCMWLQCIFQLSPSLEKGKNDCSGFPLKHGFHQMWLSSLIAALCSGVPLHLWVCGPMTFNLAFQWTCSFLHSTHTFALSDNATLWAVCQQPAPTCGPFGPDALDRLRYASKLSVIYSIERMRLLFLGKQRMHLGWTMWIFLVSFLKLTPNWILQPATLSPILQEWTIPLFTCR